MYNEDRRGNFQRRSFAPVNVGEEISVKIEAVGEKGDGIAKVKGFIIFVPNVKVGDEVKVKITKVLRKVGFGEVIGKESHKEHKKEDLNEESEDSDQESDETSEETTETEDSYQEDSEDFGEDES